MAYDMQKRAKLRCMHLLEKRDYTEKELRQKLINGKTEYTQEEMDSAIEYVKSFHYVNDGRYACKYIEAMSSRKSRRQIEQELYQKGVDKKLIQEAFEMTGEVPEEEQIARWMEKRHYDPESADPKEKQKMYAFLARKGFRPENIQRALKAEFV